MAWRSLKVSKVVFFLTSTVGAFAGGVVIVKDLLTGAKTKLDEDVKAEGKVVIVTGANTGIGKETVRDLARRGAKVYMACRDLEKCEQARRDIVLDTKNKLVYCRECDLADFDSIRKFAEGIKKEENRLDVLIANAGVMRIPQRQFTKQGIELQLGVNHMGHFLLTNLLLDLLKESAPSRIVVVASDAYSSGVINFLDLNKNVSYDPGDAYNQSKLANVLFTKELAVRLKGTGVTANAVHPGVVATEIGRHLNMYTSFLGRNISAPILRLFNIPSRLFFCKTPRQGAITSIYVALEPSLATTTGKYFVDCQEKELYPDAEDMVVATRLWTTSERWTRLTT